MGLVGIAIAAVILTIVVVIIAVVILAVASYALAQINKSDDDEDYDCDWKDSPSLKGLHVKLSWAISLSVIFIVFVIVGAIGVGVLGVVFGPEAAAAGGGLGAATLMGSL